MDDIGSKIGRGRTSTVLLWAGLIWKEVAEIQKTLPWPAVAVAVLDFLTLLVHMKVHFANSPPIFFIQKAVLLLTFEVVW